MNKLEDITSFFAETVPLTGFRDSSLNGLQVEGGSEISSICCAVDSGLAIVERAPENSVLLVHHGLFWGNAFALAGSEGRKVRRLFEKGISLYACHLPLDAHEVHGNNFILARFLELENPEPESKWGEGKVGCIAANSNSHTLSWMREKLLALPGAVPEMLFLEFGPAVPRRVCVISGGAAKGIYDAEREGFDTFITGEPSQMLYHYAKDHRLNVICAGHYATETVGVQSLAKAASEKFSLPFEFIHEPTGI
jgi:dinuclear metal center YbgI/SA1388 family protein